MSGCESVDPSKCQSLNSLPAFSVPNSNIACKMRLAKVYHIHLQNPTLVISETRADAIPQRLTKYTSVLTEAQLLSETFTTGIGRRTPKICR